VVVGAIGDDLRTDFTAIGDTTNLAARMQTMAKPGTVMVSGYTHKLARDYFRYEPLGEVEVKGKEQLQEAYELVKAAEVETRIEAAAAKGLTRFVGRGLEMESLKAALEKARDGAGQVVGIVGEAGVGKSRLLLELRNILPKGEYTYFEGRCLHYGGSMAYLPILDILRNYFDLKEDDPESVIKEKILQLDDSFTSHFPSFRELLSLKVEDEKYLQLDPGEKKVRTFEAIRDLFIQESENITLVLAVEDLHWIDRTTEEFLDYLIGWLANARILLIVLYRPEYSHQWGSKSYYSKIGAGQLSRNNSAELVQAILQGGDVVPELRELILNRAGGNPLFVEELTSSLLENGFIQRKNHQYVLTRKTSEIEVPDTIQGIIAARIDRVEENLKRIMQVASVIGREFAFRIFQSIMGMSEQLKSSLLNLQGLEFISEKRLFPELEYIFKHALTQEVAYNSLLQRRKKEIHEKIGEAIEFLYPERLEEYYELLAYHYGRSENKDKALKYLDLANLKAAKRNALQDAKAYFDEAMKTLDTLPDTDENRERRVSLLVNQNVVFQLLLQFPEYYEILTQYEPVAAGLGNRGLLGALYHRLCHCEWWVGKLDQAEESATKSVELCEAAGNVEEAGIAYTGLAWIHLYKGDFDPVITFKDEALRMLEQQFNLRWYAWALSAASWAYSCLGRWSEAVEEGEKALSIAEEYSNTSLISFSSFVLCMVYTTKGEMAQALEYGESAVEKAPTPGDKAWAQMYFAWACCRAGQLSRGIEVLEGIVPLWRAARWVKGESWSLIMLGEGYWLSGEIGRARQTLESGLRIAECCGMRYHIGWAHRLLGEIALTTEPALAVPRFGRSIAVCREIKAENELALAYAGYGRFHRQQGKNAQAWEYLTKAIQIFERLGTLIEPDKVRKELAELPEA
jgi:predicted ATPase